MTNHNNPMAPDKLKERGLQILDFITAHFQGISSAPIKPDLKPGELASRFSSNPPQSPKEFGALLRDIEQKVMPGVTHWQHPRFFSYYPATTSAPAILSETLIAAIGAVGLQWSANPIGTELECVVMDWMAKMMHADEDSPFLHTSGKGGGIIQNTAGEALVVIMTAARVHQHVRLLGANFISELNLEQQQSVFYRDSSKLVVYMSDQTHFSGPKASRVAGLRVNAIKARLMNDGNYGIDATDVKNAMDQDRAKGLIPCAVQLNYGSTNTCGYDDIESFLGFAEEHQIWLHVDAAYAGSSLILPQFQHKANAIQKVATSYNFNGSKWFLCGFDSAFLYIRDRNLLKDVFAASGDYMATVQSEDVYNPEFKDWAVPLGRRFRALRIWMVLEYFGVTGLQQFLQAAIDQAGWLRTKVDQSPYFQLTVKNDLGLVCFHPNDPNDTPQLITHLQESSGKNEKFLLYPSQLNGIPFIRVALGGANTDMEDIEAFWLSCITWAQR